MEIYYSFVWLLIDVSITIIYWNTICPFFFFAIFSDFKLIIVSLLFPIATVCSLPLLWSTRKKFICLYLLVYVCMCSSRDCLIGQLPTVMWQFVFYFYKSVGTKNRRKSFWFIFLYSISNQLYHVSMNYWWNQHAVYGKHFY